MWSTLNSSGGSARHCKASFGLNELTYPSVKYGFLSANLSTSERRDAWDNLVFGAEGQTAPPHWHFHACNLLCPGNSTAWPAPHCNAENGSGVQGQSKGAVLPKSSQGWVGKEGVREARQAEDGSSDWHLLSSWWTRNLTLTLRF